MLITTQAGRRVIIDPLTADSGHPIVLATFLDDGRLVIQRKRGFLTTISTTSDYTVYTEDGRVAYHHTQGTISSQGT
jgi:hypothetical protein